MSKTEAIHRLAVDAGLPEAVVVTYNRNGQRWYLEYPVPLGPDANLGHHSTIMANYNSVAEARERLPADVEQFMQQYRRILTVLDGAVAQLSQKEAKLLLDGSRMQGYSTLPDPDYRALLKEGVVKAVPQLATNAVLYQLTILGQRLVKDHYTALTRRAASPETSLGSKNDTIPYDSVTTDETQSAMHTLLDKVEKGEPVAPTLVVQARAYLTALEDDTVSRKQYATGRYTSRQPDAETTLLAWEQPSQRRAPVYDHDIVCAICGETTTIRSHSPNPPAVCEQENCRDEHTRILARKRKRRQRARLRQSRDNTTS